MSSKGSLSAKDQKEYTEGKDYHEYQLSTKEFLKYGCIYIMLDGCISYLFFYSLIAFFLLLPGIFLMWKEQKKILQKKREREIKTQFLDGISMLSASLQAGYSVENAMREACKELKKVYPVDAILVKEFYHMVVQTGMSRNLEDLFLDFGKRSGIDDILSFAEVFRTAKRSGGDLISMIRNTEFCIRQKQETMQEIETCLSGKVMEQNIMSLIPLLILAYVKLTSPDFLDSMYGNLTGILVMSVCFVLYVIAFFWGKKMIQIEV